MYSHVCSLCTVGLTWNLTKRARIGPLSTHCPGTAHMHAGRCRGSTGKSRRCTSAAKVRHAPLSAPLRYGAKLTPLFARNGISHKNRCRNALRTQISALELSACALCTRALVVYFKENLASAAGWTSGLSSSRGALQSPPTNALTNTPIPQPNTPHPSPHITDIDLTRVCTWYPTWR